MPLFKVKLFRTHTLVCRICFDMHNKYVKVGQLEDKSSSNSNKMKNLSSELNSSFLSLEIPRGKRENSFHLNNNIKHFHI